tara:strand:- start:4181 stop:4852 length:672 start_codon:yes stop_codon:yes gene_type:complete
MALPTSGALSLNAIHVEAGGTSGTTASLNDSDIRGLTAAAGKTINSTLGTNIDFGDFYGASSVSSFTMGMVVGSKVTTTTPQYGASSTTARRGFDSNVITGYGSVSGGAATSSGLGTKATNGFLFGAEIHGCDVRGVSPQTFTPRLQLRVTGNITSNGGFTTMTVNGNAFQRSAATFAGTSTTGSSWEWDSASVSGIGPFTSTTTNNFPPFPASGTSINVVFT